jgi:hypothetical protein
MLGVHEVDGSKPAAVIDSICSFNFERQGHEPKMMSAGVCHDGEEQPLGLLR